MAALTWRDVAAPQFGGVNQAYQGAGQTLDRALSGLSEGLKQFATTNQEGADNALLAQSMKAQDAGQMRSILANADLSKASPKVLEAMGQRVTQLLGQSSTEQGISSSKTSQASTQQNMDQSAANFTRKTRDEGFEDAARAEQARKLGLTGAMANLSTADQRTAVTTDSNLLSARLGQQGQRINNEAGAFRNRTTQRDDAATQGAMGAAADLIANNATGDELRKNFLETNFSSPQERALAQRQIEASTGQRMFSLLDEDAPTGTGTGGAKGKGKGTTESAPAEANSTAAAQALREVGRVVSQGSSASVVADIEKNKTDFRDPQAIIKEVTDSIPNAKVGKVEEMFAQALSDYPNLSAADVASAFKRSPAKGWGGSTNITTGDWFTRGQGIDDDMFKKNLQALDSGQADYASEGTQAALRAGKAISSADKSLADAKADLAKQFKRSQSQPGIDMSAAEDRVESAQRRLDSAIADQQLNPDFKPKYRKVDEKKK